MSTNPTARASACIDPMSLEALPPQDTRRWVPRRKAEVVSAVNAGAITFDDACARYDLSVEELASWQRAMDRSGTQGLRSTQLQRYRAEYLKSQRRCK